MEPDVILEKLQKTKSESENLQTDYLNRWSRNWKLHKGIFQDTANTKSSVRNRNKTFFRKIWSVAWRITASFYYAFLRDPDTFKIEGRDTIEDPRRAGVLQKLVEYRRDRMHNRQSLFIKFIWAFQSIILNGWCCGKLTWDFRMDPKTGDILKDEPVFVLYPNDQVFPDFSAQTREEMRYCHFLNYLSLDEMKEQGYINLDQVEATAPDSNTYRSARYEENARDPIENTTDRNPYGFATGSGGGHYPKPGSVEDTGKDQSIRKYKVYESFWWEDGEIKFGVHCDFKVWLRKDHPVQNPYGYCIPAIMGTCLTEMFKLIGEGFPEPLEGPQESFNYIINMRQDNQALAMTGHTFVSRYGNVDMQSLLNRRQGGVTLMDDVNAVKHEQMPDVTQSAYVEAAAQDAMSQEMSGVTAGKVGMENAQKATVAQINYTESNAKIDLYIAIVGETFIKSFFYELARQIQMFEHDETIFRIANEKYRFQQRDPYTEDVYDIDFEADCIVNVGAGTVGREMELRQLYLAMDRGIMLMQSASQLAQMGAMPKDGLRVPDMAKIFEMALVKMGHKNINDFFITLQQPMMQGQGAGGALQPQVGGTTMPTDMNMIQKGSMGGI